MTNDYLIIGAGGLAKEILFLCENIIGDLNKFKGFIDYRPKAKYIKFRGKEFPVHDEDEFLKDVLNKENKIDLYNGIGDPKTISKVTKKFENFNFPNLIHNTFVGDITSISFGKGNIITAGCVFTVDIKIGSFNLFNLSTTVGHDTVIEDCNVFNPGCNISGNVNIRSRNLFGTNSTVLQSVEIGDDNILGAGSLGNKSFSDGNIMIGIPAKPLKV
jgi:sugar O-acyltransferase (sialic acid O-acetyltransferase NeuD family)